MSEAATNVATGPADAAVDHLNTVSAESRSPAGKPCDACGCPVEPADQFCPACGLTQVAEATLVETPEPEHRFFRCSGCGSEVAMDLDQRSYVCAFCDSTFVVEFSPDAAQRQRPEFVIGFAIDVEAAQDMFRSWLNDNSWFRPKDLATSAIADKQRGVYLPFWSFSMLAESRWTATIGEYWYRTETYTETDSKGNTVTKTRQVQETEWWPLGGRHHRYHSGYLISGSRGLPQAEADQIMPFNLPALKRYQPYFLAGWISEEYSIQRDAALKQCLNEFQQRENRCVAKFLPGDTHRNLEVNTHFSQINSDLCLLPVHILSYRYNEKLYRFLINGQTGKTSGKKPVSWGKVWSVVGIGVVLLAIVILVIVALANQ